VRRFSIQPLRPFGHLDQHGQIPLNQPFCASRSISSDSTNLILFDIFTDKLRVSSSQSFKHDCQDHIRLVRLLRTPWQTRFNSPRWNVFGHSPTRSKLACRTVSDTLTNNLFRPDGFFSDVLTETLQIGQSECFCYVDRQVQIRRFGQFHYRDGRNRRVGGSNRPSPIRSNSVTRYHDEHFLIKRIAPFLTPWPTTRFHLTSHMVSDWLTFTVPSASRTISITLTDTTRIDQSDHFRHRDLQLHRQARMRPVGQFRIPGLIRYDSASQTIYNTLYILRISQRKVSNNLTDKLQICHL